MGMRLMAIAADRSLPARVDVVVVGGGIVGVCTALALSEKGISVAVCEKGVVGGEQSGRNWGWCRTAHRDLRELPLSIESLRLWRQMDRRFGIHTGFRESGVLYAASSADQLAEHEHWLRRAKALLGSAALSSRVVSAKSTIGLMPGIAELAGKAITGGLLTPTDGQADPERAVPAIALALRARRVRVLTPCAVRGIETSGGVLSGVVTEYGSIRCTSVVVAGGAWTRLFCANLGIEVPQLTVRSSVLCTAPVAGGPEISACHQTVGYRKRSDGGYSVGSTSRIRAELTPDSFRLFRQYWPILKTQFAAIRLAWGRRFIEALREARSWHLDQPTVFETVRTLDPTPNPSDVAATLRDFRALFPKLSQIEITRSWAGYIDVTPDAVPIISSVDALPGLVISTGYSGHGFGIGPSAGELAAALVANDAPVVDTHAFRLGRFSDGSPIELDGGF